VALLAALALHMAALAAVLWRPAPSLPAPPILGVPLVFAKIEGPRAEGAGAAPPPSAPPVAPEAPPPVPPADIPSDLPEPVSPSPEQQSAAPDAALPMPALPMPPPAPPAPPAAPARDLPPGALRLGAGLSLPEAQPGPDRAAARRSEACSDSIEYPMDLQQAGIGGEVLLRLRLTDKGRVIETRVVQSSGNPQLDEAVSRSARRCRFDPALRDGVPVFSNRPLRVTLKPP
jgi:protein TonB